MSFKRVSIAEAKDLLSEQKEKVQIVDIRDDESYERGHISQALHLHGSNLQEFISQADLEQPLLVYCYHGHTSQSAAAYLVEQGFADTCSLDGGYEAWSEAESAD